MTELLALKREAGVYRAISEALAAWQSSESGTLNLLRGLAEALGCLSASLWVPASESLFLRRSWCSFAGDLADFETVAESIRLARGSGLPGKVWQAGKPLLIDEVADDPSFLRRRQAVKAGLHGALGFPLLKEDELLAVIVAFSAERLELDDRLRRALTAVGHELGQFLARRRGALEGRRLTPREIEVLELAADGLKGPEIAARLGISPATIKTHFGHIYEKLLASDRAGAVAQAMREGLIG